MKAKKAIQQKCTVKIHEMMVNNIKKNHLSLQFLTSSLQMARVKVIWNRSMADNNIVLNT